MSKLNEKQILSIKKKDKIEWEEKYDREGNICKEMTTFLERKQKHKTNYIFSLKYI